MEDVILPTLLDPDSSMSLSVLLTVSQVYNLNWWNWRKRNRVKKVNFKALLSLIIIAESGLVYPLGLDE